MKLWRRRTPRMKWSCASPCAEVGKSIFPSSAGRPAAATSVSAPARAADLKGIMSASEGIERRQSYLLAARRRSQYAGGAMRRFAGRAACLLGALLALPATAVRADRLWTLQLRGGSLLLSLDAPEERGPILVFHRHPDGVFSSLRTGDVLRIS